MRKKRKLTPRQVRKQKRKILRQLAQQKSAELNTVLRETGPGGEGWDAIKVQQLLYGIRILNKRIEESKRSRKLDVPKFDPWKKNPFLVEINKKYLRKPSIAELRCPECDDMDHDNRINGKPWCFKCDVELLPAGTVLSAKKEIKAVKGKIFIPDGPTDRT